MDHAYPTGHGANESRTITRVLWIDPNDRPAFEPDPDLHMPI